MRRRLILLLAAITVLLGLLTTPAAQAAIGASISFLHEDFHLYSAFPGPARIHLTWGSGDPDVDLTFRLRRSGTTIHQETYHLVTPGASNKNVDFTWPAQSVTEPTDYQVTVHRGSNQLANRTFTLLPPLVKITKIAPNPFFPRILDGYRDTTDILFHLEASSNPVIVRIYRANTKGACCGDLVRQENLGDQAIGDRTYTWNGRRGDGTRLGAGKYFVRITATKLSFPEDVTRTSKPKSVTIKRFRRVEKTVSKNGIAYHHRSPTTVLAAGGSCTLQKILSAKDLGIRCDDGRVSVFWRWSLPGSAEIEGVSFVMVDVPGACHFTKGHTQIDTFIRVGGLGANRCRVDKAKVRYSFLKAS